jgi:hypothetical protein
MTLLIALSVSAALVQAPAAPATGSVLGVVLEDGTGTPIEGAQVTVMPVRSTSSPVPVFTSDPPLSVRTDQNGRFAIRGLEPGRYRVAAQKSGYAMAFGPGAATSIELAAGGEAVASLSLQRGVAIVGRVINEAGEPVINGRVMAMRQLNSSFASQSRSAPGGIVPAGPGAQTNDLGEFRLFGLPAGEYYLQAMPGPEFGRALPTSRTLVATFFPDASEPGNAQTVVVGAGQTSDAIVIRMKDAPAFQVSGIVLDEAGRPVANAMVRLDPDVQTGRLYHFWGLSTTRTNASGAFSINNVTSASYTLIVIPPLMTTSGSDSPASGGGSVVTFSSGGSPTSGVFSESRSGVVTHYRDDLATKAQISVNQGDVSGIQVIVRLPR